MVKSLTFDASTTHAVFVIRLKALGFQVTTLWTAYVFNP
jgi:hypothetical protein